MTNFCMRFPDGKSKAITLSYDDGVRQDKRMVQILNRYGIKCTFNINGNGFSPDDSGSDSGVGRMSISEALDTYCGTNHEIAIHGFNHAHMGALSPAQVSYEIVKDKEALEDLFHTVITGGAYPYGAYNQLVMDVLKNSGIHYCRTVDSTENFFMPKDWLQLKPTCHHNHKLMELTERFLASKVPDFSPPSMLYVWGHTYEFDNDNNWDCIEEFCKKAGGHEDIWYATNGEIWAYDHAYRQLRFSTASTRVYNPTALELWFTSDHGKLYTIQPGEIIEL